MRVCDETPLFWERTELRFYLFPPTTVKVEKTSWSKSLNSLGDCRTRRLPRAAETEEAAAAVVCGCCTRACSALELGAMTREQSLSVTHVFTFSMNGGIEGNSSGGDMQVQ